MTTRIRDPETGQFVSAGNGQLTTHERHIINTLSEELTRRVFGAGFQYGQKRQVYDVAGYPASYSFSQYYSRYLRQPEARRVVDMPVQTTWRNPPDLKELDADGNALSEETAFTTAFEDLRKRLQLWQNFERADRLARIGRYGVLLIGARGPDQALREPLERLSGPEDVLYVEAYDEGYAEVKSLIEEPSNERYGEAETYQVTFYSEGAMQKSTRTEIVHYTRMLHIAEDRIRDRVYGSPALEPVLNPLISLEKVSAATGEAYWQLADKILVASIDKDTKLSSEARSDLLEALGEMIHDLRRQVAIQGGELSWLGGDTPDPLNAAKLYQMQIASTKGIPFRVMFGNETGERASSEDLKSYMGYVAERQERFAEPVMVRAFVDRMIDLGALPRPVNGYAVVWPTLWETPEKEVAETDKAVAETAKALTPVGGDPVSLIEVTEEGRVKLIPRAPGEASPFDLPEPDLMPGEPEDEGEMDDEEEGAPA